MLSRDLINFDAGHGSLDHFLDFGGSLLTSRGLSLDAFTLLNFGHGLHPFTPASGHRALEWSSSKAGIGYSWLGWGICEHVPTISTPTRLSSRPVFSEVSLS
jgi:hypothetical protein